VAIPRLAVRCAWDEAPLSADGLRLKAATFSADLRAHHFSTAIAFAVPAAIVAPEGSRWLATYPAEAAMSLISRVALLGAGGRALRRFRRSTDHANPQKE
jgi:hypothetical protein